MHLGDPTSLFVSGYFVLKSERCGLTHWDIFGDHKHHEVTPQLPERRSLHEPGGTSVLAVKQATRQQKNKRGRPRSGDL